jgi:hypothetical protein
VDAEAMSTTATDDRFDGPMVPETILAEQMLDVGQHSRMTGERRLMIAVLEDGVRCVLKLAASRDPLQRGLAAEAEEWIRSTDRSRLFAFENVCQALDLDPDYVRDGILKNARTCGSACARTAAPDRDYAAGAG